LTIPYKPPAWLVCAATTASAVAFADVARPRVELSEVPVQSTPDGGLVSPAPNAGDAATTAPPATADVQVAAPSPATAKPLVTATTVGQAGETPRVGFDFGVRVAYGAPAGMWTGQSNDKLGATHSNSVPLWFDLGARLDKHWYIGAYLSYGFNSLTDSCRTNGNDCSSNGTRLGVNVQVHPLFNQPFDPWFGFGAGYEWLWVDQSARGATASVSAEGPELLNLQLGLDFHPALTGFAIGPFVSLTMAQFMSETHIVHEMGQILSGPSDSIEQQAMHEWFFVGIRMHYDTTRH
jgi:hypothetical protein